MNKIFYLLAFVVICILLYFYFKKKIVISTFENFLSKKECEEIISLCESGKHTFFQSRTTSGNGKHITHFRTSSSVTFQDEQYQFIKEIKKRISEKFNIELDKMEPLQVTKYLKGQEYKYHYDFFRKQVDNQRKHTFLIYLNSLSKEDGGETHFKFGNSLTPKEGMLVHWNNLNENGEKNKYSLHASKPILTDKVKYIITVWTRENVIKK